METSTQQPVEEKPLEVQPLDVKDRAGMNLWQKLAKIRENVRSVPKRGWNDHFKYWFVQAADVYDVVGTWMGQLGIVMMPVEIEILGTKEAAGGPILEARFTWEFINADKPDERQRFFSLGFGQDRGDKCGYKATTGAEKYALISAFQVPTGLDPERVEGQEGGRAARGGKGQQQGGQAVQGQGQREQPAGRGKAAPAAATGQVQQGGQARSPAPSEPRQQGGQKPTGTPPPAPQGPPAQVAQQAPALDFGRFRGKPLVEYTPEDLAEAYVMTGEAIRRAGGPTSARAVGMVKAKTAIEHEAKVRGLRLPGYNPTHNAAQSAA